MVPCPRCRCHIHRDEHACPHCGAEQRSTGAGVPAGVRVFTWLVAAAAAACSAGSSDGGEDGRTVTTATPTETSEASSSVTTDPTTSTEDTSTETGSDTLSFVPNDDLSALYGVCDTFAQDCPEGEKCVAYASSSGGLDAQKCVPVVGDLPAGSPCDYGGPVEATDDCDASSACWLVEEVDGELMGVCMAFCQGTIDQPSCADQQSCLVAFDGSLSLCVDDCDPFAQDCAASLTSGLACHFNEYEHTFNCWLGPDTEGQACDPLLDSCAPGLVCLAAEQLPMCADAACCTAWCDLGNPSCAMPGTACTPYFEPNEAPQGAENLGVCSI